MAGPLLGSLVQLSASWSHKQQATPVLFQPQSLYLGGKRAKECLFNINTQQKYSSGLFFLACMDYIFPHLYVIVHSVTVVTGD